MCHEKIITGNPIFLLQIQFPRLLFIVLEFNEQMLPKLLFAGTYSEPGFYSGFWII